MDFTRQPVDQISRGREFLYCHPVVRAEVALREPGRGNGDLVTSLHQMLGDLPHNLLDAAATRIIKFTTEEKSHLRGHPRNRFTLPASAAGRNRPPHVTCAVVDGHDDTDERAHKRTKLRNVIV